MNKPTQDERLAEREAIVAWLKAESARFGASAQEKLGRNRQFYKPLADHYATIASCIERGDHIPSSPEGGD